MADKILIIGKRSFIGMNLYNYLKFISKVKIISYTEFLKKKNFSKVKYIINCSISKSYVKNKYNSKFDIDFLISRKIQKYKKCKLVFLSSRKIYKPKPNIKENGILEFKDNYSKNKYITETKLVKNLKNRVLVLRISNLIGLRNLTRGKSNRVHKTFIDYFVENINKGIIFDNKIIFKDFLPINIFCKIVFLLIKKNKSGIFNVSIGKKVYLKKIVKWLNYYNLNKYKIMKISKKSLHTLNRESFYLNNSKLISSINIKISLIDLKKECLKISKELFYEKK